MIPEINYWAVLVATASSMVVGSIWYSRRVFGTRYAVLALPCGGTVPDAALCKELRTLYKVMVPHPYYRGQVIFYGS